MALVACLLAWVRCQWQDRGAWYQWQDRGAWCQWQDRGAWCQWQDRGAWIQDPGLTQIDANVRNFMNICAN